MRPTHSVDNVKVLGRRRDLLPEHDPDTCACEEACLRHLEVQPKISNVRLIRTRVSLQISTNDHRTTIPQPSRNPKTYQHLFVPKWPEIGPGGLFLTVDQSILTSKARGTRLKQREPQRGPK